MVPSSYIKDPIAPNGNAVFDWTTAHGFLVPLPVIKWLKPAPGPLNCITVSMNAMPVKKLTNHDRWVTSPLWIPIGLALLTIVLVGINNFITNISKLNKINKKQE